MELEWDVVKGAVTGFLLAAASLVVGFRSSRVRRRFRLEYTSDQQEGRGSRQPTVTPEQHLQAWLRKPGSPDSVSNAAETEPEGVLGALKHSKPN